jgi:phosphopantetheine adenylyltransferase
MDGNGQPLTRAEFLEAMSQLREQLRNDIDERFQSLKEYVDERTHDAETRLLRGFADFSTSYEIRMRKMNADMGNLNTSYR